MAYSKIILNGETLMDVTSDTVDAGNLLSGKTATKNSGAKVTGNIVSKSSSDLIASGATVTAPAGYYSAAASKAVTTTTHPNPTAAIASSTGVVTATHTQGTGYVTGGTTTGTLNLTTQAAQTIYPSTADQTIASYRWLTEAQTIKSVTTSNLTAANIASGVTVKVGDSGNASRITQITGTYGGGEYYNIYKCLVNDGIIYSSGSAFGNSYTSQEVSNWCDSYGSIISDYTFAGKILSGSFTFSNVSTISRYAFAFALPDIGQVTTTPQTTLYFPEASEFKDGCFLNATRLKNISASKCERILQYAFGGCTALSSVSFPNCSYISASAFVKCKNLISANFSSCEYIGSQAFAACVILSDISFPACTSIGSYAFASCSALTTASFPSCISMGSYAFAPCSALTTVSFPVCTSIGSYAFASCIALTSIFFPVCNYIGENAFKNCSALTTASFSKCEYIGGQAFSGCRTLTEAIFPACTQIGVYVFAYCSSLRTASFPICSSFGNYTFQNCYNLISLYLNNVSSVPTFGYFMFNSTPISNYSTVAGRYGSIFVPSSLYTAFTTATSWSSFSARMVSV